jgi:histidinol phosphatase-like enzyme
MPRGGGGRRPLIVGGAVPSIGSLGVKVRSVCVPATNCPQQYEVLEDRLRKVYSGSRLGAKIPPRAAKGKGVGPAAAERKHVRIEVAYELPQQLFRGAYA